MPDHEKSERADWFPDEVDIEQNRNVLVVHLAQGRGSDSTLLALGAVLFGFTIGVLFGHLATVVDR